MRLYEYLPYLFLTLAIETPLVLALLGRKSGVWRALLAALASSSLTHPLLVFVWSRVVSMEEHYDTWVASGEVLVVIVEAGVYLVVALPRRRAEDALGRRAAAALGMSALVNFASWGTGAFLHALGMLLPLIEWMTRALVAVS